MLLLMVLGRAVLLAGMTAVIATSWWAGPSPVSWQSLLVPYSLGEPLPDGFRIAAIRRGPRNDVVVAIERPGDGATVEVHVAKRGRWPDVLESRSFGIGYERMHSSAPEREAITAVIATAIRANDRGLPPPDAIPLAPAADSSLLPCWLEMMRGWQGLLLGVSLSLLALLALSRSSGLALASILLGGVDLLVAITGVPPGQPDLGGRWLLVMAVLLSLALARRSVRPVAIDSGCWQVWAVAVGGLVLRLVLGPWGPLHVNGMAPFWVAGASRDPLAIAAYGPGYREIFGVLTGFGGLHPDTAIFLGNALLSALLGPLAYEQARRLGIGHRSALFAALVLTLDPVAIRMSTTEAYFPAIMALGAIAGVVLLAAVPELEKGDGWRVTCGIVGASLFLVQAARIHPSAWGVVTVVPLVLLASPALSVRRRGYLLAAVMVTVAGMLMATSAGGLLDVYGNIRSGTLMLTPARPAWGPLLAVAVVVAAYLLWVPRRWLAIAAAASLAALLLTRQGYAQSWIWQQCYDRLYLTLPIIALVGAVPQQWLGRAAIGLGALAWLYFGLPIITARTTDHDEYRWLREQLTRVPASCRVIYVSSAARRGIVLPAYVRPSSAAAVAMHPHEPHTIEEGLAPAACLYYVRTSLCASADGRPACAGLEDRLALAPIARESFPARPSSTFLEYDQDPVEVVLARVEQVDGVRLRDDAR